MERRDYSGDLSSPALINSGREKMNHGRFSSCSYSIRLRSRQDSIGLNMAYTMKWMYMLDERFEMR